MTNNRTRYFINPKFQTRCILNSVGSAALAISVFLAANVYFFWKLKKMGVDLGLKADSPFFQFIGQQEQKLFFIFAVAAAVTFVFLTVRAILFSHKIAGPLYKLHRHMKGIAEGQAATPVQFREKDFFPELADAFNAQLGRIDETKKNRAA